MIVKNFKNMILLTYKFVFAILFCKINAVFKNSGGRYQENVKTYHSAHVGTDKKGLLNKLYYLKKAPDINRYEQHNVLPFQNGEPTKKNSHNDRQYIQEKDNHFQFQAPMQYIEDDEFHFRNTIQGGMFASSFNQANKECHPLKNDIADLFNKNIINISLETEITKKQSSEIISNTYSPADTTFEIDSTRELLKTRSKNKKCTQKSGLSTKFTKTKSKHKISTQESDLTTEFVKTKSTEKKSVQDTDSTIKFVKKTSMKEKNSHEEEESNLYPTPCTVIKKISTPLFFKFTCGSMLEKADIKTTKTKHTNHKKTKKNKKYTTPEIINMFRHVTQESKVNVVVNVHCDKSEGNTHIIQQIPIVTTPIIVQNVYITPNMITQSPYLTYQTYTKKVDKQIVSPYLYLNKYGQITQTQNFLFQSNNHNERPQLKNVDSLAQQKHLNSWNHPTAGSFDKLISKIKLGKVPGKSEKKTEYMEIKGDLSRYTTEQYNAQTNSQKILPQPFLPQDIILKCNTPPKQTQPKTIDSTLKVPLFLCQITNGLCKAPNCKPPKPRKPTTPKFNLWKDFSFPLIKFKKVQTEPRSKNITVTHETKEGITANTYESETSSPINGLQITRNHGEESMHSMNEIYSSETQENFLFDHKTTKFYEQATSDHTDKGAVEDEDEQEEEEEQEGGEENEECEVETHSTAEIPSFSEETHISGSSENQEENEPWRITKGKIETYAMSSHKIPNEGMGTVTNEAYTFSFEETDQLTYKSTETDTQRGDTTTNYEEYGENISVSTTSTVFNGSGWTHSTAGTSSSEGTQISRSSENQEESEPWRITKGKIETYAMSSHKIPIEGMGTVTNEAYTFSFEETDQLTYKSTETDTQRGDTTTNYEEYGENISVSTTSTVFNGSGWTHSTAGTSSSEGTQISRSSENQEESEPWRITKGKIETYAMSSHKIPNEGMGTVTNEAYTFSFEETDQLTYKSTETDTQRGDTTTNYEEYGENISVSTTSTAFNGRQMSTVLERSSTSPFLDTSSTSSSLEKNSASTLGGSITFHSFGESSFPPLGESSSLFPSEGISPFSDESSSPSLDERSSPSLDESSSPSRGESSSPFLGKISSSSLGEISLPSIDESSSSSLSESSSPSSGEIRTPPLGESSSLFSGESSSPSLGGSSSPSRGESSSPFLDKISLPSLGETSLPSVGESSSSSLSESSSPSSGERRTPPLGESSSLFSGESSSPSLDGSNSPSLGESSSSSLSESSSPATGERRTPLLEEISSLFSDKSSSPSSNEISSPSSDESSPPSLHRSSSPSLGESSSLSTGKRRTPSLGESSSPSLDESSSPSLDGSSSPSIDEISSSSVDGSSSPSLGESSSLSTGKRRTPSLGESSSPSLDESSSPSLDGSSSPSLDESSSPSLDGSSFPSLGKSSSSSTGESSSPFLRKSSSPSSGEISLPSVSESSSSSLSESSSPFLLEEKTSSDKSNTFPFSATPTFSKRSSTFSLESKSGQTITTNSLLRKGSSTETDISSISEFPRETETPTVIQTSMNSQSAHNETSKGGESVKTTAASEIPKLFSDLSVTSQTFLDSTISSMKIPQEYSSLTNYSYTGTSAKEMEETRTITVTKGRHGTNSLVTQQSVEDKEVRSTTKTHSSSSENMKIASSGSISSSIPTSMDTIITSLGESTKHSSESATSSSSVLTEGAVYTYGILYKEERNSSIRTSYLTKSSQENTSQSSLVLDTISTSQFITQSLPEISSKIVITVPHEQEIGGETESKTLKHVINLGGNKYQFYFKNRWYISDRQHIWLFDSKTSAVMNESFHRVSKENIEENTLQDMKTLQTILIKNGSNQFSEKVPFELFAQSILKASTYNNVNSTLNWGSTVLNYSDVIAMLRLSEFDSFNSTQSGYEWGGTNWDGIYNRLKQSETKTFPDRYEYKITDDFDNETQIVVYFNGSSTWKDKKLDPEESLTALQNVNSNTIFSRRTIDTSYVSNEESFTSFVKDVFKQQTDSKTKYTNYQFKNKNMNYDELLALMALTNASLSDNETMEASLNEQNVERSLTQIRSSKKLYFSDRTVYNIMDGPKFKPITIFTNGTLEYNRRRVTFEEMSSKLKELPSSNMSRNVSKDIQHTIRLGGGKYQFYWKGKWYITDQNHIWPFEDETSKLKNKTFFGLTEDKTANKESIGKLLNQVLSHQTLQQMPFELFSQSVITAGSINEPNAVYKWGNNYVNYGDMLAMLRLSNFTTNSLQSMSYQWGQTNWQTICKKVKEAPKSKTEQRQEYNVTDFDGTEQTLIVFKNGTSMWKNQKVDIREALASVIELNKNLEFPENVINSPYVSNNKSFETFVTEVAEIEKNNITYSRYVWNDLTFTRDEVLAINRMIMQEYFWNTHPTPRKDFSKLSFSGVILPLLKAKKNYSPNCIVFNIDRGPENRPLTVYHNGTTNYFDWQLELCDAITNLEKSRNITGPTFKEDTEGLTALTIVYSEKYVEDEIEHQHYYDWEQMYVTNSFEVYYPISIGAGLVQFFVNLTWYVTDGDHMWNFFSWDGSMQSDYYLKLVVIHMNQTFADNPNLDTTTIQELVNNKTSIGSEELLFPGISMPFEIMSQHVLFLSEKISIGDRDMFFNSFMYYFRKSGILPSDIVLCVILTIFDKSKKSIMEQISWGKTRKVNWDWLIIEVIYNSKRIDQEGGATYQFTTGAFIEYPDFIIHKDFTIAWEDQTLNAHELLKKVKHANKKLDRSVIEIKSVLFGNSMLQTFNFFAKQVVEKRIKNEIAMQYNWNNIEFNWYDFLAFLRFSDSFDESVRDDIFWDQIIIKCLRAYKINFIDGFTYQIEGKTIAVYMNETTDFQGEVIIDYNEYLRYFLHVE